MLRRILLTAASIFLAYQSWRIAGLVPATADWGWFGCLALAFSLNLGILGTFAFAGFAWPLYRILPASYYHIDQAIRLRLWSERLGLQHFRNFLLLTFWRSREHRQAYFNGQSSGLAHFDREARRAEFGHLGPFLILSLISGWGLVLQGWIFAFLTVFFNILANAYPIVLQRLHRARLQPLLSRRRRSAFAKTRP